MKKREREREREESFFSGKVLGETRVFAERRWFLDAEESVECIMDGEIDRGVN